MRDISAFLSLDKARNRTIDNRTPQATSDFATLCLMFCEDCGMTQQRQTTARAEHFHFATHPITLPSGVEHGQLGPAFV
jgi:uncharacterized protein YlaI